MSEGRSIGFDRPLGLAVGVGRLEFLQQAFVARHQFDIVARRTARIVVVIGIGALFQQPGDQRAVALVRQTSSGVDEMELIRREPAFHDSLRKRPEFRRLLAHHIATGFDCPAVAEYEPATRGRLPRDFHVSGYDAVLLDEDVEGSPPGYAAAIAVVSCTYARTQGA